VSPQSDDEVRPLSDDEVLPPSAVEPSPPPEPASPLDPAPPRAKPSVNPVRNDRLPEPRQLPPEPAPPPPKPSGTFSIGAGFSSDDGFIAAATIAQPDLFRTGNLLMMHARISARRQLFLERFADPDLFGSPVGFSADLYADTRELPGFTRKAVGGALTLSRTYQRVARFYVGYRLEDVEVESKLPALRSTEPLPPLGGGILSALRAGVVIDTTDHSSAPNRGSVFGAEVEVANGWLGSDLRFVRNKVWAQHHQPIGPLTLHVGGSVETIGSFTGGIATDAPRSERLFLQSSNEIRGYRPDAFGPVDALGTPVGARGKLLGSIELEAPLVRRIGLSAFGFADAGALGGNLDTRQWQVGRSVGFGLLWRSPIGTLKFSWALPLDGGKPGFVFGLGAAW